MMKLPLGFRVSGCFGTKHPIVRNISHTADISLERAFARVKVRDYYVVPNCAHTYVLYKYVCPCAALISKMGTF